MSRATWSVVPIFALVSSAHSRFLRARKKSLSLKQPPHPLRRPLNLPQQSPLMSLRPTPSSPPSTT